MPNYLLKGGTVATFVTTNNGHEPRTFKADVLVEGSTITKVEENILPGPGVEVIDCENKWITPGMVDTHREVSTPDLQFDISLSVPMQTRLHDVLRLKLLTVLPSWLLSEYLVKMSWNTQPTLTADEVRIGQLAGCLDALHSGVTTILDHFHAATTPAHAEASLAATIESGARVVWCPARQSGPTQLFPTMEFANDAAAAEWQMAKLKEWGSRDHGRLTPDGRVTLGLAYDIVWKGPMSEHQAALKVAREIPVSIITAHVVQGPQILTWRDGGILGPDVVFSHCNVLAERAAPDDEMWAAMKESGAAIASTPVDELGMAHGNPVAIEALQRGVKCGLGVDAVSINGGGLFAQMQTALQFARGCAHERVRAGKLARPKHNAYSSADAFRLATLGGAEALNLAHLIGTVEVGKKADLLVYDADSVNLAGIADPIAGVVFAASSEDIELVMVDGEIVKRAHTLVRVSWPPVARELQRRAQEVRERFPHEKLEEIWSKWYETNGPPVF
ncbi:5'-deoxyadenosine deaminase [Grifola frondosa]|uniref:5'-deoxyadenosine deaminase n=1 Tax=Grifola frondosa TaxID=5627 RepID=A0A1C7M103_GRIFR|nr:5'-deoxyadenosine deaminase [Grifola frondosa]